MRAIRRPVPERIVALCRELRAGATTGEALLWRLLRNRGLEAKFRRQHPIGSYIVDFYCREARLVIEVDGGGHAEPAKVWQDEERDRALQGMGLRVLRFWNRDVLIHTEDILETIWDALNTEGSTASGRARSNAG